jgi:allantoinase
MNHADRKTLDLTLRGGAVVTPEGTRRADVLVSDGVIVGLADGWTGSAEAEIDARGLYILPGMVDSHVHLMDPGNSSRETFLKGTSAAAAAGVTTIIEHTHGWPVINVERLREKLDHLTGRSYVDYGLAAHAWPGHLDQFPGLWSAGIAFFKIFTCTTHGVPGFGPTALLDTLNGLASLGGRALVHCEDEEITAEAERVLRAADRIEPAVLIAWRNREAEQLAVARVAVTASLTDADVRIAHASTPDIVRMVRAARGSGVRISAETCPQYVLLRENEVERHGALRKFTPPARIRSAQEEDAMWKCLCDEDGVEQIASDHAPSTRAQKLSGDIWSAPFGLPGLDTTLPVLIDACLTGRLTFERVATLYAASPARYFGLPGKGAIRPGNDADLVLVDPGGSWHIDDADIRSGAGWSPYSGRQLRGRVQMTLLRGQVLFDGAQVVDQPRGRFVPGPGAMPA